MPPINDQRPKDTGLAILLIMLLVELWAGLDLLPYLIGVLLVTMIWPKAFYPASIVWFKFSDLLGRVVSNLLLSSIYFALITPIGLLRRFSDPMRRKSFGGKETSALRQTERSYRPKDFNTPF